MSSIRRDLLDKILKKNIHLFTGKVLDVGGKKIGKRGKFIPPIKNIERWEYLNTDEKTNPDFLADICSMPFEDDSYDVLLVTEVLEYIKEPVKAVQECYRVLKKGGNLIISVPFMHPMHYDADFDMQRFTQIYLRNILSNCSFSEINFYEMGSVGAVLFDFLNIATSYASKNKKSYLNMLLQRSKFIFLLIDKYTPHQKKYINTGYFIVIKK